MILETTVDLKKYVSLAQSFHFDDFEPYIQKAVDTYTYRYVGDLHEFLADQSSAPDINFVIKNKARGHLRNAIANFGIYIYFPFMSVMLDSSGATIVNNDQRKSAEWWQQNDMRRECLRSGHEAMDYLLEILEKNPDVFVDWTTDFSTINNELLVKNTATFDKYYSIFNSRQTFLALQPSIRQVEDQYLKTMLCPELVEHLKTDVSGVVKDVKEDLQKAIVAFTIAKVADEGLFLLDENGLRVNFQTFVDGRKESASYGKPSDQISKLVEKQINNGSQYLAMARELIEANLDEFNQCEFPLKKSNSSGTGYTPYDTPGVLSI